MELDTFNECVQEAIQENQGRGKSRISEFEEKHLLVGLCSHPSLPPAPCTHPATQRAAAPVPLMTPEAHGLCPHLPELTQLSG